MRIRGLLITASAAGATALASGPAAAVGTRTFELDTLDKLSGGDVHGVTIGSDGVVRAGWTLGNAPLPADSGTTAPCAVALPDGSVLVGTGPATGGKVVRVAGDQASLFADTKESAVSGLAVDRGGVVYAATTSARIYRVSQGAAQIYATLPGVDSVLSLAVDKLGALYAGTGADGAVVRIAPGGASSVYFKTDEPFVVSLAMSDDGVLYAGTSGKGLIYRITGPGRGTVLFDPPGEDVRALSVGPGQVVYAIANEEPGASQTEEHESSSSHRGLGGRSVAGPTAPVRSKPGKGSLWRFDAEGRPERMMHHDEFHYASLGLDTRGAPFVGTGAQGRVYTVDNAHVVSLVADTSERQITAVGLLGKTPFALGSDPATFHRILSNGGPEAVWTSKPLDAGLRARFGHLRWRATGTVEVSTRSGDTPVPDTTWSVWTAPAPQGAISGSPPARFVQIRARLRDAAATIADPELAFATENLRAVVTEITARDRPPAHESKDALPASGGEVPKHESVMHVGWKVDNPDSDELHYRVHFRREGGARWIDALPADETLTKAEIEWDTTALPEGKYRLRVEASDDLANPPGDVTRHALESAPVLVDNTPPTFRALTMTGRRLRAEVVDGLGPIARVDVAIDGRTLWRPLAPLDGIFDTADEAVDADITALLGGDPGPHVVTVRAFDAAGNAVVRSIETAP
jgi:hypothetical protein